MMLWSILLGLVAVMCMVVLKGSLSMEGGETKKGGQARAASVGTGENEGQESGLSVNGERVEESDADYYFISWGDKDYLLVTKREEGQVNGIAVYHMFDYTYIGWILGLKKQPDGEIEVTYYNYIFSESGVQGESFPDC